MAIAVVSRWSHMTCMSHNRNFISLPGVFMNSSRIFYRSTQLLQMRTIIPQASGLTRKTTNKSLLQRKSLLAELERPTFWGNEGMKEEAAHSANFGVRKISNVNSSKGTAEALPIRQLHQNTDIGEERSRSYFEPSQHMRKFEKHLSSCHSSTPSLPSPVTSYGVGRNFQEKQNTSLGELEFQEDILRESFEYAYKHHRVRLRKDPDVYRRECAAYCRAHPRKRHDRVTAQEVNPYTEVALPSVTALRALAHLNPKTSSTYAVVQQGLLLQQNVMRNQLMVSSQRTLVRCLRCFHVYPARPRTLWGTQPSSDDGVHTQHSWQSYQLKLEKVRRAKQLSRCPHLRKKIYSVGQQRSDFEDHPTCCPFCGSPKAQWAMEYVHNRTHARTA